MTVRSTVVVLALLTIGSSAVPFKINQTHVPDFGDETVSPELKKHLQEAINLNYVPGPTKEPLPLISCWETYYIDGENKLPIPMLSDRKYHFCTVLLYPNGGDFYRYHGYDYDEEHDYHIRHQFEANPKARVTFQADNFIYLGRKRITVTRMLFCKTSGCNVPFEMADVIKFNLMDKSIEIGKKIDQVLSKWEKEEPIDRERTRFYTQTLLESEVSEPAEADATKPLWRRLALYLARQQSYE